MELLEKKLAEAFDTPFNWRDGTIVLHGVEIEYEVWGEHEFATVILKHVDSGAVMCFNFDTDFGGIIEDTTVFELAYFNWLTRVEEHCVRFDDECFLLSASIDAMLFERAAFFERCGLEVALARLANAA